MRTPFLKVTEGPPPGHGDLLTLVSVSGNPTIGVGFDLGTGSDKARNSILKAIGFNAQVVDLSIAHPPAAGTPQAIEYSYVQDLRAQMRPGGSVSIMNAIMSQRAENSNAQFIALFGASPRRETFSFANESEVKSIYRLILPDYVAKVTHWNNWGQTPVLQKF